MTNENEVLNESEAVNPPKFDIGCTEDDIQKPFFTIGNEASKQNEVRKPRSRQFSREHSAPPSMLKDCQTDKDGLRKCKSFWEQKIQNHEVDRLINPFSEFWGQNRHQYRHVLENASAVWKDADKRTQLTKADDKYGLVVEGTLTEKRGKKAKNFIAMNIIECCETIQQCGHIQCDGSYGVKFGKLFKAYERINDKLVGLLVRARRHGLVEFPGEMLYQGQDDNVIIKLIKIPTFEELDLKFITFDKPSSDRLDKQTAQ